MIRKIRIEFNRVHRALIDITNRNVPMWAAIIWFILTLPIGIALYPIFIIWEKYQWRRFYKGFKDEEERA